MKKSEFHWILFYAAILAFVTTLPYLIGYFAESEEWRFTGFVFGVEDGNSYIAKMLLGSEGAWLFRTPYSSMEQSGIIAFLPYILLGKLASGPGMHEQLVGLYHLFRVLVTPFAVYATYQFASLFIKEAQWRKWATVLSTAGGGLGWLMVMLGKGFFFGSLPMDWISPEWFGFLAFLGYPHLILARALLLMGLTLYLTSPFKKNRDWLAGLCFIVLGFVHPLAMATAIAILGVHQCAIWATALVRRSKPIRIKWLWIGVKAIFLPLPLVVYYFVRFSSDPYLSVWTSQNQIFSPHPVHILIAYGWAFFPAVFGVRVILKSRRWTGLVLLAWLLAFPIFAYAPHNLQRRLPDGIWVAWSICAVMGMNVLSKRWVKKLQSFKLVFWGFSLLTTIMLLVSAIQFSVQTRIPIFRHGEEVEVFQWLQEKAEQGSVVLSSFATGNAMPAWASVRVVIGHGPETAELASLEPMVYAFYSGDLDVEEQIKFIQSQNISYIFWGPLERIQGGIDLMGSPLIELCFESGKYQLFEVQ
ncbi:MAG: hypothetical protein A2Z14_09245 [Chloroflexi bacterium RBG_16_48_8]|nr:MAG: hypothetical protein A2Z14_09245 [Chloroflexi bacterium RBG_16_48_8]